tara:strand:- start:255 stop:1001 length:747 start_codon:yes stop_codon:yes gene_type:complete
MISADKALNVANLSNPTTGGLLDEFVRKTKARNKKSVDRIAKGKRQENNIRQSLKDIQKQEMDEARKWTPERIEKQLRRDDLDKQWYDAVDEEMWNTERAWLADKFYNKKDIHRIPKELRDDLWAQKIANDISKEMSGYTINEALDIAKIQPWKPMTINRAVRQVNRMPLNIKDDLPFPTTKGNQDYYGPELIRPQTGKHVPYHGTSSKGILEEYYRKMGMLGPEDIDFKDIPTFIRNHLGKWDDPDF